MRSTHAVEISTGLFVLLGFTALLFLTTQITGHSFAMGQKGGYHLQAAFENIGGLKVGAPVSMAGVNVGRIESIKFDQQAYKAQVSMRIDSQYDKIPNDSDASILTSGLLGGQYLGITAGGSDQYYKDGDRIDFVQDALVLENLISKFLVNFASRNDSSDSAKSGDAADTSDKDTAAQTPTK